MDAIIVVVSHYNPLPRIKLLQKVYFTDAQVKKTAIEWTKWTKKQFWTIWSLSDRLSRARCSHLQVISLPLSHITQARYPERCLRGKSCYSEFFAFSDSAFLGRQRGWDGFKGTKEGTRDGKSYLLRSWAQFAKKSASPCLRYSCLPNDQSIAQIEKKKKTFFGWMCV